jgi:transcriptional regulator GlxA family with amidase domain
MKTAAAHTQQQRHFSSHLKDTNLAYLKSEQDNASGKPSRQVGFLLLEHFSMMAFTGAVDALVTANLLSSWPLYRFKTLGLDCTTVPSDLSINISVDSSLASQVIGELDMLIVCGGFRTNLQPTNNLLNRLRKVAAQQITLGGLWNGSYILARAGLLDGYQCTIHPENRAGLEETCPRVRLLPLPFVVDRNRISCAGANSALGMMLEMIRREQGDEMVRAIEEILSCDKAREEPDQPMRATANNPRLPGPLKTVLTLMECNIEEPLSQAALASYAQVSTRQTERLFKIHLNTTPSKYYLELRITHARRLLLQTNRSITSISVACGFVSTTHFSHRYRDYFGQSPTLTRQTHGVPDSNSAST